MSGCKVALSQGRYKWRHDKVLKVLAKSIQSKISENVKSENSQRKKINFVKEGEKGEKVKVQAESYLSTSTNWKMSVDLEGGLKIPIGVSTTNLRPDITIVSATTKQMGMIELTVPIEERVELAGELKKEKYQSIVSEGKQNGWRVKCWAVEIGCRGFPALSLSNCLKDLGYSGKEKKETIEMLSKTTEEASRSVWRASHYERWGK